MAFKILFMGTPDFAVPILKSIHESKHKVIEVYTQSPKKKIEDKKFLTPLFMNMQIILKFQLDVPLL